MTDRSFVCIGGPLDGRRVVLQPAATYYTVVVRELGSLVSCMKNYRIVIISDDVKVLLYEDVPLSQATRLLVAGYAATQESESGYDMLRPPVAGTPPDILNRQVEERMQLPPGSLRHMGRELINALEASGWRLTWREPGQEGPL